MKGIETGSSRVHTTVSRQIMLDWKNEDVDVATLCVALCAVLIITLYLERRGRPWQYVWIGDYCNRSCAIGRKIFEH